MISVLFFGTPKFSVPTFDKLCATSGVRIGAVITQPDKPSGRGSAITPSPIKVAAEKVGIPVFQPRSLKREFVSLKPELDKLGPFDLGVVIAFGQLLPEEVLSFPRRGCINIHASILPRWRGAAPIQRAIEAGDLETGVCLMKMELGLDTGDVFVTSRTPILESDTNETLQERLSRLGADLLAQEIVALAHGTLPATPQGDLGVSYAKKITSQEAQIDWSQDARAIERKIRAISPFPGCYTVMNGRRLKIFKAHVVQGMRLEEASPGMVIRALSDTFTISCGKGALRIEEVQLEGKRRMSAAEFIRGIDLGVGMRVGI